MIISKNSLIDGSTEFSKGVETHKAPSRVPRNQLCFMVNGQTRTDYIGVRSPWHQHALTFVNDSYSVDTQTDFEQGLFQGFSGYVPDNGSPHLVFSISGKLFRVNVLGDKSVQAIRLPDANPSNIRQVWFKQAELFLIWQDNTSKAIIYDGTTARRSRTRGFGGTDADGTPLYEVPVGNVMEYSMGRLWVALPDGRSFVAGDGVYGPTGTAQYQSRDAVLKFTENKYLAGGFPFAVPANLGGITAMRALANLDTSLGQGPLQVFTPSGAFSIQAPFDRALWADVTDPIKTVSLLQYGFLGADSTVPVNGDLWGRVLNGIWSFIIARRDFGMWSNHSMAHEVGYWLGRDDLKLLRHGSAALFDDRLLMTIGPQWVQDRGVTHSGLVSLDFHPLTSIAQVEQPTWDGAWTQDWGDLLKVITVSDRGVDHCYAAVLATPDAQGVRKIQLWELQMDRGPDVNASGTELRITRQIESARYDFAPSGSNRLEQKLLEAADLWVSAVSGTVDFWLYYRPDEYPCWFFWKHWQICAKTKRCAIDAVNGCLSGLNLKPQFRPRIGAGRPPDALIGFSKQPSRLGYGFQWRLETIGDCDITAVRLLAERVVEATFGLDLPGTATCDELICCDDQNT